MPYKLNCFEKDLSLESTLSFWLWKSVEEVLIYAHTAGCFLHCNRASFSSSIGQDLDGKEGKSKVRHCHGTDNTVTMDKQVHRSAGMHTSSRKSAPVTQS